jgi:SAM-dependent methyltransferase
MHSTFMASADLREWIVSKHGYDEIADWYEYEFHRGVPESDALGIKAALHDLLGSGSGMCLDLGCGTGAYSDCLRELGWSPIGVDRSAGMLRHASPRLPVVRATAECLPFADRSLRCIAAVMVHTDMPAYPVILREAARVLEPSGVLVHVGVHPCFCGGFADRSDPDAVIIRPGYLDHHWTTDSWTDQGLRDKVGASHFSLPELLDAFIDAGFHLDGLAEGGAPVPAVLAVRACLPSQTGPP